MKYDFDRVIDRRGTGASQYEKMQAKFGRTDLQPLWIADCDFAVADEIMDALRRRLEHPVLGYSAPPMTYWQSIIDWERERHGLNLKREDLAFLPGLVRGLGLCISYFSRPGDKILIQPPVYHQFSSVIEGNGRKVLYNPLTEHSDGSYDMDFEGLETLLKTHRPAMMIVCNPHNPIGKQWDAETLARVAKLAKDAGTVVVSDEIYGDYTFDGRRHVPFLETCPEASEVGLTLGSPSKTFNIPGMASSWIAVRNPRLREGFYAWMGANEFCEPILLATIAAEAAYRFGGEWADEARAYVGANADFVIDYLREHMPMVKARKPETSFVMWLDFRALGLTQPELLDLIWDKAKVAISDGTTFGPGGEGHMRLNIGTSRANLTRALDAIAGAVKEHTRP